MRVVFFSGSGISQDSGIPTFRGRGGLYGGAPAEEVLSAETLRTRPALVHAFFDDFRQAHADKLPNAAHRMVADWKRRFPDRTDVLTMNVDGLFEAAGCPDVVHLHGVASRVRSTGDAGVVADIGPARYWSGPPGTEPSGAVEVGGRAVPFRGHRFPCPATGKPFRPDVVLFGEDVADPGAPYSYIPYWRALRRLGPDDALVVVGTRGDVVRVCHDTRGLDCLKVLNNLDPADPAWIDERRWDKVLHAPAAEAAPRIAAILDEWRCGAAAGGGRRPAQRTRAAAGTAAR